VNGDGAAPNEGDADATIDGECPDGDGDEANERFVVVEGGVMVTVTPTFEGHA
jgi:hypothetical protein